MAMIGTGIVILIIIAVAPFVGTFFLTGGTQASWRITGNDLGTGVTLIPSGCTSVNQNGCISLPTSVIGEFNLAMNFLDGIGAMIGIVLIIIGAIKMGTGAIEDNL
ncbi:MAG: hypothetical protein JRN52_08540 [Nitrososphaerota archaeon]|nr:hypothetical protein [Nitrososphaerota archaeon]